LAAGTYNPGATERLAESSAEECLEDLLGFGQVFAAYSDNPFSIDHDIKRELHPVLRQNPVELPNRKMLDTGLAPRRPEIQERDPPSIILIHDRFSVQSVHLEVY